MRYPTVKAWAEATFTRSGAPPEHFPAFEQIFQRVYEQQVSDFGIDPLLDHTTFIDDEPSFGTVHDYVEERSLECLSFYPATIAEQHSPAFALKVAVEMVHACDDLDDAKRHAFEKLSTSSRAGMTNPAFAEAYETCVRQGKSEFFAQWCAQSIAEDGWPSWKRACEAAKEYDKLIQSQLKKGRSVTFAVAYAFEVKGDMTEEYAEVFAKRFEEQLALGKPEIAAHRYASVYVDYCESGGSTDESDADNIYVILNTEAHIRAEEKGFDVERYVNRFTNNYFTYKKATGETHEQILEAVERMTDEELVSGKRAQEQKPSTSERPKEELHPNFARLQEELRKTAAFIDELELDEEADATAFREAIESLEECIDFPLFEHLMENLPSYTEQECDLGVEIQRQLDQLVRTRDTKIRELGYDPD